ncbi:acyl-CoA dehydrogenase [Dictyobacter sp. S3.2.2.5]|uniref:Acyl-CoA dehydrogenase n=2 Tax=Dictyobacter halimunensis TaxID=3026934 RepID=A0ABQ6G2N6_9CHLR|nr:acyl-CoA dehydrogenase [Dictyobacter sp. S3.2.2.5]
MTLSQENNPFACVVKKIDPEAMLLDSHALKGGVSAQVTVLEAVLASGERKKMIVRRHGANDLRRNPHIAADEFRLLRALHAAGLAVPEPYYLDQSDEIFASPYVVIEYVEGETIFAPAQAPALVPQMATHLASIHALDPARLDLAFLPNMQQTWNERFQTRPATLDDTLSEGRIRDALAAVWPPHQRNPPALLHGDFWPGNLLWRDGQLAAIVDWEDAALGDPLCDLANSRLEILWAFGREAMEEFTRCYQALRTIDYSDLPVWDLCAALRPAGQLSTWIADPDKERKLQASHHWFITRALSQL